MPLRDYNVDVINRKELIKTVRRKAEVRIPARLNKERAEDIQEVIENLCHMSERSILLMKNAAEVLRVRDKMEEKEKNPA